MYIYIYMGQFRQNAIFLICIKFNCSFHLNRYTFRMIEATDLLLATHPTTPYLYDTLPSLLMIHTKGITPKGLKIINILQRLSMTLVRANVRALLSRAISDTGY